MRRYLAVVLVALAVMGCVNRSGTLTDADSTLKWSNTHVLSKSEKTGTDASYQWAPDGSGKYVIAEAGSAEDATDGLATIGVVVGAFMRAIEPVIVQAVAQAVKEGLAPTPETGDAVTVQVKKEPLPAAAAAGP